ncbi:MAG: peptide deformylase [Opitutae bacterium]|nr:peptide deformylase [Opitutae bacterium]
MPLPIVQFNEPILRKKGAKVSACDAALRKLAAEMVETMHAAEGIGLAAQQIGQAIQLCVVDLRAVEPDFDWELNGARPPLELFMPLTVVNPVITPEPGGEASAYEEGCLSFPRIRGDVVRPDAVRVAFQDGDGHPHTLRCNGLFARCLQHEADHLNGILFIDRMEKDSLAEIDAELKALKKRTRDAAKK